MADRTYLRLEGAGRASTTPTSGSPTTSATFTTTTLSFTLMFMNGMLAALSFSGVLWTISPLLFGVAVGYAALGTLGAIYLGLPLVGLVSPSGSLDEDLMVLTPPLDRHRRGHAGPGSVSDGRGARSAIARCTSA